MEMKAWQKGIELEKLQAIEDFYAEHNKYAFSPFTEMNKPRIADALDRGNLIETFDGRKIINRYVLTHAKVTTPIKCFDNIAAYKQPGDIVITKVAYLDNFGLMHFINTLLQLNKSQAVIVTIFEEDKRLKEEMLKIGYKKICSQYKSTAEILGVYGSDHFFKRDLEAPEEVPSYDVATLVEILPEGVFSKAAKNIMLKIDRLGFANHYSNYNKGKTWSALSIRGYDSDVAFIEKPAEVIKSKKFFEPYKESETYKKVYEDLKAVCGLDADEEFKRLILKEFKLQNTELFTILKRELLDIVGLAFGHAYVTGLTNPSEDNTYKFDRIRLMKLSPGGGELLRHSDLQDPDVGTSDGRTMRFHIPIITNPDVDFSAWDWNGVKQTRNFKEGCLFYLDQRKPHTVINNGDTERIHLVFDVIANDETRRMVADAFR